MASPSASTVPGAVHLAGGVGGTARRELHARRGVARRLGQRHAAGGRGELAPTVRGGQRDRVGAGCRVGVGSGRGTSAQRSAVTPVPRVGNGVPGVGVSRAGAAHRAGRAAAALDEGRHGGAVARGLDDRHALRCRRVGDGHSSRTVRVTWNGAPAGLGAVKVLWAADRSHCRGPLTRPEAPGVRQRGRVLVGRSPAVECAHVLGTRVGEDSPPAGCSAAVSRSSPVAMCVWSPAVWVVVRSADSEVTCTTGRYMCLPG